ncbi:glutathionylspermidine synthase family protein [Oceanimonas smirnovii]|uniref:glutathionylspermidine synthase family protein n=1 Tax=Oceanimonas smirnovii TaxID=264574 RepID=UPI0003613CA6|nr:glutathionylspermidine synthase family protein [Oceanimonas smirnovii]
MKRVDSKPRAGWDKLAESLGFHFHTIDGEPYWDESAYYKFTLDEIETGIEDPTSEIHAMCLELVDEVVKSESLMDKLLIPEHTRDLISDSWRTSEPSLYGRMDFSYDGTGPAKFYEYNADTPTSLYETGFFQWLWLEQKIASGDLPSNVDQYNRLQEALIERFSMIGREKKSFHLACCRGHQEDLGTIEYLFDCASQAGLAPVKMFVNDIGVNGSDHFIDLDGRAVEQLFKLYPWEWIFQEPFSNELSGSKTQWVEPIWKAVLSNKGILPLLWERHPGHPNLLPAWFEGEVKNGPERWVKKPLFSREGANITVESVSGVEMQIDGPYEHTPCIIQSWFPPPCFAGNYCLIGSWVVGNEAVGMGVREDNTAITQDTSRFLPHIILD